MNTQDAYLVMLRAADIAEKVGDNIGQCDPRTGELSERDANRAEGCYQVAERLRVEAKIMAEHNTEVDSGA